MQWTFDIKNRFFIFAMLCLMGMMWSILLHPGTAFAETKRRLSLLECLDIAYERNPAIHSAQERLKRSRLGIKEAYASILPRMSTLFEYTHRDETNIYTYPEDNYSFGISLEQPLFDQGKYLILRPQADLNIEASLLELETTKHNIFLGVIGAYLNTLKAEEMLVIARESKERLAEHLRVAKQIFEVGRTAKNDVLRAEMELANAESDLIHAEKACVLSYENLQKTMFIEDDNFTILPLSYIQQDQKNMEELIDLAYQKRPDYLQAIKTKEIAKKGISLAKRDFFPMVTVFCEYERNSEHFFPNHDITITGGRVSLPLFEGGIRMVRLRKARHNHTLSEYQEADLKKQIRVDVIQAFLHLEDLLATRRAIAKQIEHARENMLIVEFRYQEGEATNLDVMDANILLVKARTDYATLNYDIIEALFAVDKASGVLTRKKIRFRLQQ